MTTVDTVMVEPRSTCRKIGAVAEQNLLFPASAPSTARPPFSSAAQVAEVVVGLPSARLVPRSGAAGGGVKPSLNEGGASAGLVPQLDAEPAIWKSRVAPFW